MASLLWDRALSMPLERPGSVTTEGVKKMISDLQSAKA
jgi:hypothetical protein